VNSFNITCGGGGAAKTTEIVTGVAAFAGAVRVVMTIAVITETANAIAFVERAVRVVLFISLIIPGSYLSFFDFSIKSWLSIFLLAS
jgi:hypothetical protein